MISISGTLSKAWMAKELGVEFGRDYYFDPDRRRETDSRCNDYALRRFPGIRLFYSESNLAQIDCWERDQIQIGGIQPNLILGMLLGANFVPSECADADINPAHLAGSGPLDLPAPESLLEHELVGLFDEQIRQVQQDSERRLRPIPPFFWDTSGRATIHGAMTSAQKLFGEAFFMDMLAGPKHALQTMHWIGAAFVLLCRHFSQIARIPIAAVHVGECSACMVGPELIRDFVVPVTSQIGRDLGPVRLHSCGPSTNHLAAFAEIENLRSLDLGPDTCISKAREIFGKEMLISIAPAPQDMSADTPDPILRWAAQVLEHNAGGNLEFVYHLEPGYNLDTIRALTDLVKNLPPLRNP